MIGSVAISAIILCNNLNWEQSPRCTAPPVEFHQTVNGWEGTLESGVEFSQTYITKDIMIFQMENVKWLTYKDKIVYI